MATQTEPPTNALYQALSSPEPGTGLVVENFLGSPLPVDKNRRRELQ